MECWAHVRLHVDDGLAHELFATSRDALPDERRHLLDRFTLLDTVRQVVGVGSVGMRVHLVRRVVEGKRLAQSATEIFVGWTTGEGHDYYVRQFRDLKIIAHGELISPRLTEFATACAKVVGRSHARTGDPVAIAADIGKGRTFDQALGAYAHAYADQTERDHRQPVDAIAAGRPPSAPGW